MSNDVEKACLLLAALVQAFDPIILVEALDRVTAGDFSARLQALIAKRSIASHIPAHPVREGGRDLSFVRGKTKELGVPSSEGCKSPGCTRKLKKYGQGLCSYHYNEYRAEKYPKTPAERSLPDEHRSLSPLLDERWLPIPAEPLYEVSNKGFVRSTKLDPPRVLIARNRGDKGQHLTIENTGLPSRRAFVAEIVLGVFQRGPLSGEVLAYRDDDPTNCSNENLYWTKVSQRPSRWPEDWSV